MSYRLKVLLGAISLAFFTGGLVLALTYFSAGNILFGQIQSKVLSIAVSAAELVDADAHERIQSPGDESTEDYRQIERTLRAFRDQHRRDDVHVAFIYTIRPIAKGVDEWEYVVDAEEEGEDKSHIGDPFSFEADVEEDAFKSLAAPAAADRAFTHDEYGSWLSADAPIHDSKGRSVARVGVDLRADDVIREQRKLLLRGSYGLAAALVAAVVFALLLTQLANRPLEQIKGALSRIGAGDLDTRLEVTRKDEFGLVQTAVNTMATSLQQREALAGALTRYVSHDVAREVIERQSNTGIWGERRRITVLFADIRGFTGLSDRLDPEEVVLLLNEFFEKMVDAVFANRGTLDKFIGDGLMATFGTLTDDADQERHAVETAEMMCRALRSLDEKWKHEGRATFRIGIGIHTGVAIVGNMGSEQRMDRTAVGKTVNIASRIEACNKDFGTTCLVSEATYEAVRDQFEFREAGTVTPRGVSDGLKVFKLPALEG